MRFRPHDFFDDPRKVGLFLALLVLVVAIWASRAGAQTQSAASYPVSPKVLRRVVETLNTDCKTTQWTLKFYPISNQFADVYENGLLELEGPAYSLSGETLNWAAVNAIPCSDDQLVVKYFAQY